VLRSCAVKSFFNGAHDRVSVRRKEQGESKAQQHQAGDDEPKASVRVNEREGEQTPPKNLTDGSNDPWFYFIRNSAGKGKKTAIATARAR